MFYGQKDNGWPTDVCPLFVVVVVVICSNKLSHTHHVWSMCNIIYYVIKYYPGHVPSASQRFIGRLNRPFCLETQLFIQ